MTMSIQTNTLSLDAPIVELDVSDITSTTSGGISHYNIFTSPWHYGTQYNLSTNRTEHHIDLYPNDSIKTTLQYVTLKMMIPMLT